MLNYIILFFVMAIIAGVFGFSGMASDFAGIAKFLALIFVVLFVVSLVYRVITRRKSTPIL